MGFKLTTNLVSPVRGLHSTSCVKGVFWYIVPSEGVQILQYMPEVSGPPGGPRPGGSSFFVTCTLVN